MAPEYIELTEDQIIMGFASSCVEWVAEELNIDYQEAFQRLDKFGLIESFIIGCYPALHTQSKEHVTEDIIHALKIREEQMNKDKVKTVNTIVMSSRIGLIVCSIANKLGISNMEALRNFYLSKTCRDFHNTSTGLYLYGNNYIVDEYLLEKSQAL